MPKVLESDQVFKKPEVVVGHPQITDHNINDEYFKNPPHNVDHSIKHTGTVGLKEGQPKEPLEPGAPDDAELGRVKKEAELAEVTQDHSVHS